MDPLEWVRREADLVEGKLIHDQEELHRLEQERKAIVARLKRHEEDLTNLTDIEEILTEGR